MQEDLAYGALPGRANPGRGSNSGKQDAYLAPLHSRDKHWLLYCWCAMFATYKP